jgi:nucleoid DNA-binding protein
MMIRETPERRGPGNLFSGRLVKTVLANEVAETIQISRKDASGIIEVIFNSMCRALQRGERVELRGFGVFGIRKRGGRAGRNPKTGTPIAVPAKKVVFFALSRSFQRDLNRING